MLSVLSLHSWIGGVRVLGRGEKRYFSHDLYMQLISFCRQQKNTHIRIHCTPRIDACVYRHSLHLRLKLSNVNRYRLDRYSQKLNLSSTQRRSRVSPTHLYMWPYLDMFNSLFLLYMSAMPLLKHVQHAYVNFSAPAFGRVAFPFFLCQVSQVTHE